MLDGTKNVTATGIRCLVASPICKSLEKLAIKNFEVDSSAIRYIARSE